MTWDYRIEKLRLEDAEEWLREHGANGWKLHTFAVYHPPGGVNPMAVIAIEKEVH